MLIEKCRICGSQATLINKITCGGHGYFVECWDCHTCTETKLTKHGAWKAWNKFMHTVDCVHCTHYLPDDCRGCYDENAGTNIRRNFERSKKTR